MKLLDAFDANPMVEYRIMLLCDRNRMNLDPLGDLPDDMQCLLHAGPQAVVLCSAANRFFPDVRVEAWDAEPPAPPGSWDQIEQASFSAPSKIVVLWGPTDEDHGQVKLPSSTLRLRAFCTGGAEAVKAVENSDNDVRGVERWVLQIWPR